MHSPGVSRRENANACPFGCLAIESENHFRHPGPEPGQHSGRVCTVSAIYAFAGRHSRPTLPNA
jgi:hypothetical protein